VAQVDQLAIAPGRSGRIEKPMTSAHFPERSAFVKNAV